MINKIIELLGGEMKGRYLETSLEKEDFLSLAETVPQYRDIIIRCAEKAFFSCGWDGNIAIIPILDILEESE